MAPGAGAGGGGGGNIKVVVRVRPFNNRGESGHTGYEEKGQRERLEQNIWGLTISPLGF